MRPVEAFGDGVRLTLHIQPRASRTELAGMHGDALKVRIAAPPIDGAANAELAEFLAGILLVPRSSVSVVAGERGRRKLVAVAGIDVALARLRLGVGESDG
jgi:uncharacterized protein (TIGR00251 family)